MNQEQMRQLLHSALTVLKSHHNNDEKVSSLTQFISDCYGEMIYGMNYEDVREAAKDLVSKGYMSHIKALLQIMNVKKLEEIKDDKDKLQVVYDVIKILQED